MNPDKIVNFLTVGICILVTLLDFIGVLDAIPWLATRIPTMTLLAVALFGLYQLTANQKQFDELKSDLNKNRSDVPQQPTLSTVERSMLTEIASHLDRWDREIYLLLDDAIKASSDGLLDSLQAFVKETRKNLVDGRWFKSRVLYPWDFTISVISLSNKTWLENEDEAKINQPVSDKHPFKDIFEKPYGSIIWQNDLKSFQIKEMLGEQFPIRRFTKMYFREIANINAVILFELHLNLIDQLPKAYLQKKR